MIRIVMVRNTIQTVNSPIYEYMSTLGNTAKLGSTHTETYRQHKVVRPWWERTYNVLVSTPLSQRINPLCQPARQMTGLNLIERYCENNKE